MGGSVPKSEFRTPLSGAASGPERGLWTPARSESRYESPLRSPESDGTDGSDGRDVLSATVAPTAVARNDT
jgi:hypothetical protein